MKNIITVATNNYLKHTRRLLSSLNNTNSNFLLTVYCESRETFKDLEKLGNCAVVELKEIRELGVKRAKFKAYYEASETDFLYLDSDILVLDSLSELFHRENVTGCFDDLSACPFIINPKFPWKNSSLDNKAYINSGVFFAPCSECSFFKTIYQRSLDDREWQRYTIQNRLYDNHFLCAMFGLYNEKVDYVDEEVYNWQGFWKNNQPQVKRCNNQLVNKQNGKKLKIVHFAGVQNIDKFILNLPIEISSLLAQTIIQQYGFSEDSTIYYLSRVSPSLANSGGDQNLVNIVKDLLLEIEEIKQIRFKNGDTIEKDYSLNTVSSLEQSTIVTAPNHTIDFIGSSSRLGCDVAAEITITLTNESNFTYSSNYLKPIYVSYHWLNLQKETIHYDGLRTEIPFDLQPSRSLEFAIQILPPSIAGQYILQIDLVQEQIAWFHDKNPSLFFTRNYIVE